MADLVYLDNNATTRVAEEVLDAMSPYYRDVYGNAHAAHSLGRRAQAAVEAARGELALLVGCAASEVVFTSCGTEGNALTIRGLLDQSPRRRKIVATAVEHPSVLSLLRALERQAAIELVTVGVDSSGAIDLQQMEDAIDDDTLLVCVMLAQNETGVLHPVEAIARMASARGAMLLVDAVQAAGKVPISFSSLQADFMTISGHKFHAPKGVGALVIRRGLRLQPIWYGGGQELGLRSGTEPVPSIVGAGVAARLALEALPRASEITALRDHLETSLRQAIGGLSINGVSQPRLPNTASLSFHGRRADDLVRVFDQGGVCVSAGAACHSGSIEPSATIKAMALPLDVAMGTVRFTLSRYTTRREIEIAIDVVTQRAGEITG